MSHGQIRAKTIEAGSHVHNINVRYAAFIICIRNLLILAILTISSTGCRAVEDKRTFQYLNTAGFGGYSAGDANTENYLEVGDLVTIKDSLHADLLVPSQDVGIDGTIFLPEIGQLLVRNYTRAQLKSHLDELYAPYYDKTDIQVKIDSSAGASGGKKYFMVGEVAVQGKKAFRGNLTVIEAILESGPKKETANLGRIQLIRGDPVDPLIIIVNFHDVIDYGDTTYNLVVRENDIIYIPPTLIGSVGNFIEKLFYPVKVILQPLQQLLLFFTLQNNPNNNNKVF